MKKLFIIVCIISSCYTAMAQPLPSKDKMKLIPIQPKKAYYTNENQSINTPLPTTPPTKQSNAPTPPKSNIEKLPTPPIPPTPLMHNKGIIIPPRPNNRQPSALPPPIPPDISPPPPPAPGKD